MGLQTFTLRFSNTGAEQDLSDPAGHGLKLVGSEVGKENKTELDETEDTDN
jgi:hypothetical protein